MALPKGEALAILTWDAREERRRPSWVLAQPSLTALLESSRRIQPTSSACADWHKHDARRAIRRRSAKSGIKPPSDDR